MSLFRPTYKKDGKKGRSKHWWFEYRKDGRRFRCNLQVRDKNAAKLKAAEILRDHELGEAGVNTYRATREATLEKLVLEYGREMARLNRDPDHITTTTRRIKALLLGCRSLSDATPERVRVTLTEVIAKKNLKGRTANGYRIALSGFFSWLVKENRWATNPLRSVPRAREDDPETPRRAFEEREFIRFLSVVPFERAVVYALAATTGFRRRELKTLPWAQIDFAAQTITGLSRSMKNRKTVVLPVTETVIAMLRELRAKAPPNQALVFTRIPRIETFRRDLGRAEIKVLTPNGKLDFHCLRVTFATSEIAARLHKGEQCSLVERREVRLASESTIRPRAGRKSPRSQPPRRIRPSPSTATLPASARLWPRQVWSLASKAAAG
jgi:integrase